MFSLGLGIATVRIIAVPLLALTDVTLNIAAAISFWAGWLVTFGIAEWWIRHTRQVRLEQEYQRNYYPAMEVPHAAGGGVE